LSEEAIRSEVSPGRWGTNRRGDRVHFFVRRTDTGKCESLCGRMKQFDEGLNARLDMEHWNPDDSRTCKTCLLMQKWFKNEKIS